MATPPLDVDSGVASSNENECTVDGGCSVDEMISISRVNEYWSREGRRVSSVKPCVASSRRLCSRWGLTLSALPLSLWAHSSPSSDAPPDPLATGAVLLPSTSLRHHPPTAPGRWWTPWMEDASASVHVWVCLGRPAT